MTIRDRFASVRRSLPGRSHLEQMGVKRLIGETLQNIPYKADYYRFLTSRKDESSTSDKKLFVIVLDCVRADAIDEENTPNIARLAEQGVDFSHCIAQAPFTTTSVTSILTGQNPYNHGVRHLWGERISETDITLPDVFDRDSLAIVSCFHLTHIDLQRGFDDLVYPLNLVPDPHGRADFAPAETVTDVALDSLDVYSTLFLHYFDAHVHSEADYEEMYHETVSEIDEQIGRLLDNVEDATVVLTADHGKKWTGEHGFPYVVYDGERTIKSGHGPELYNEALHVPLIIDGPEVESDTVDTTVRSIDILPTVGNLLDGSVPQTIDGRDILSGELADRHAYSETFTKETLHPEAAHPPFVSLQNRDWKLVCAVEDETLHPYEAYDLRNDPEETKPLDLDSGTAQIETLYEYLQRRANRIFDRTEANASQSAEVQRRLEELGYLE